MGNQQRSFPPDAWNECVFTYIKTKRILSCRRWNRSQVCAAEADSTAHKACVCVCTDARFSWLQKHISVILKRTNMPWIPDRHGETSCLCGSRSSERWECAGLFHLDSPLWKPLWVRNNSSGLWHTHTHTSPGHAPVSQLAFFFFFFYLSTTVNSSWVCSIFV